MNTKPIINAAPQGRVLRERTIPELADPIIKVGDHLVLKRFAQSADMAGYTFRIKGKLTHMYVMAKFDPKTALGSTSSFLQGRRALVLTDRDGPLDKCSAFLNKPDKAVIAGAMIPAALVGAKRLHDAGVGLAIVTNQGGYQIGQMSFEETVAVNVRIAQQLADAGAQLDAIFICPFSKGADTLAPGAVDARKPEPGMPLQAARLAARKGVPILGLVGDQRTDGAAAQRAGMLFVAITDPVNGRWQAELTAAQKKNEELPKLDASPGKMISVHDFIGASDALLKLTATPNSTRPAP
jgi:D-glycero-D-manno-heptose 1,7-bisphosphate phosphatase